MFGMSFYIRRCTGFPHSRSKIFHSKNGKHPTLLCLNHALMMKWITNSFWHRCSQAVIGLDLIVVRKKGEGPK